MNKRFLYTTYKNPLSSVKDVTFCMEELEKELLGTDMKHLQAFNRTYLIITRNVFQKLGTGYFEDDELMQKLDIRFAGYYFDALKEYTRTKKTTPAWEELFDLCRKDTSYEIVYLAMGVNAHVNNDLPLTLRDVVKDPSFKEDYDKINEVIGSSLHEIFQSLERTEKALEPVYAIGMNRVIRKWRKNAWNTYLSLVKKTTERTTIERNAFNLAVDFSSIYGFPQMYKMLRVVI